MKILAAVYSHPDYYPPTINAINSLSQHVDEVIVLARNVKPKNVGVYNKNISIRLSGSFKSIRETEQASYLLKLKSFFIFSYALYKMLKSSKPKWFIAYDPIPLLSFKIVTYFIRKRPKIWYHNHDVLEKNRLKKYSISWFAYRNEQKNFNKLEVFTLPSLERQKHFPMNILNGKFFFLPNYPVKKNIIPSVPKKDKTIKLIYQGHIGEGHGLVEIINYLKVQKTGLDLKLNIIGFSSEEYIKQLYDLISSLDLGEFVEILAPVNHSELMKFTAEHDIGLAIHQPINIAFKTAATSSNKIYEYISCGLPVIMINNSTYEKILGTKGWAFFTNLTNQSLDELLNYIYLNRDQISAVAKDDFQNELNFERYFSKLLPYILS
ncbi:glycosyltransferase [Pedobacter sp. Leaf250]|uniref:glycosyltransferase n=1 Tax=Pedobacter sp. Leaf250 TaxID=2876559 RepID=UPI001E410428|nr:glycosyltransferase [Pedobacter sp. Leaf250]